MVPMHDQPRARVPSELVQNGETMFVGRGGLMRDQDIETFGGKAFDILGENRVAVPQRQAAAPSLVLP